MLYNDSMVKIAWVKDLHNGYMLFLPHVQTEYLFKGQLGVPLRDLTVYPNGIYCVLKGFLGIITPKISTTYGLCRDFP